jgi:hypothetical protein
MGRKHSKETKLKMSLAQRGENNSNWKGGLPKCQVCGKRQTVHHSPRCRACANKDIELIEIRRKQFSGKNNPLWKGVITELTHTIRELAEMHKWRDEVFAKSDYKCEDCGKKGYLEAHHIKAFTKLFKEFTNLYNQFSVVDDKDVLIRLALTYKPFFDVSNGRAVCKECHEKYRIEARRETQATSDGFSVGETTSEEASKP